MAAITQETCRQSSANCEAKAWNLFLGTSLWTWQKRQIRWIFKQATQTRLHFATFPIARSFFQTLVLVIIISKSIHFEVPAARSEAIAQLELTLDFM